MARILEFIMEYIPGDYRRLINGKRRISNWLNFPVGRRAIADFRSRHPNVEPIITKLGRNGGTWAHPELAAIYEAWCDPNTVAELYQRAKED